MPENEKPDSGPEGRGAPDTGGQHDVREEYRSLATDIAAVATPVAVVAAPVVNAWAKQHFNENPKDDTPAPQQQPKNE
jgi:hypothetical protein